MKFSKIIQENYFLALVREDNFPKFLGRRHGKYISKQNEKTSSMNSVTFTKGARSCTNLVFRDGAFVSPHTTLQALQAETWR